MLQKFLIDEFIGSNVTGIGNKDIDGFFFDDNYGSRTGRSVLVVISYHLSPAVIYITCQVRRRRIATTSRTAG